MEDALSELRHLKSRLRAVRQERDEAKAERVAALAVAELYRNERTEAEKELRRVQPGQMSLALDRVRSEFGATAHELQRVKARLKTVKQARDGAKAQLKSSIAASVKYQNERDQARTERDVARFAFLVHPGGQGD